MNKEKLNIAYERLSRDDEATGDSLSIQNQKMLLEAYAIKNGIDDLVHLTDDGWSGTRWDRPGIVKMIEEVENNNVATIICKDMSRLGRDHLRVGLLLEQFREQGVRFVAINDNVDTARNDDDFTPFRNIINEWVARDTSRKIRAINEARIKEGRRVSGAVPYGYLRDPDDKDKWIIDEDAAPIVRRMFLSIIKGKTVTQIADELTVEGILTPAAHWTSIEDGMAGKPTANPTTWSAASVIVILRKQEHMGWTVLNKSVKETYKSKRKPTAPEDMLIIKDTHPAIVDEETWNIVQRLRETPRRPQRFTGDVNPLTGILYCADCDHKMYHKRGETGRTGQPHHEYVCSSYRHYSRSCTCHYIRVSVVEDLILDAIRKVSGYVRTNEVKFVERVRKMASLQQDKAVKESRRKLAQSQRRRDELNSFIKKLYESYATGKIPEKHFIELLAGYDTEQTFLDDEIIKLQSEIEAFNVTTINIDKFIELVNRYTEFTELSPVLLNEFIAKVIVHEAVKIDGFRTQEIEIFFTFIGKFELAGIGKTHTQKPPMKPAKKLRHQMTPEELTRERERDRVRYAKKRDAMLAAKQAEREAILQGTSYAV
jgi:DNA invertase Pin-like site-specific DNA recombinase